jgi:beta-lactamase regulating signal transducer with metallopeptidase domain
VIAWFAENLVWASAAMLLVLAIRRPVARHFGAGIAYSLWLIPALRLVAPPADWIATWFDAPLPSLPPLLLWMEAGGEAAPASSAGGLGQWLPILLALWVGGALLFLGIQALAYRRFLGRLSLSMQSAGDHEGVALIESAAVEGPLALGLLDRRIVVPAEFDQRYSPSERLLALDHERYHHRRGDILANHLALVVLALNWCNPVAWIAFRAFRADQELSCDAAIAAAAEPAARADYARALVKSASRPGLIAACPLNGADQLKRRLKMLNHHRKDRRRLWAGSAVTATLIGASMLLGAPGHAQERDRNSTRESRERVIVMEHRDGERARGPGERRNFMVGRRDGDADIRLHRCQDQGGELLDIDEGSSEDRVRMMFCSSGEGATGDRLTQLQRARERVARNDEFPADLKERVLNQLDQAIARARGR